MGVEGSYSKNISLDLHAQKRKSVVEMSYLIESGSMGGEGGKNDQRPNTKLQQKKQKKLI